MIHPYLALRPNRNVLVSHYVVAGSKNPLPLGMESVNIDLGVGEEMNQLYISKLREQLDAAKVVCKQKCDEIELQKQTYQSLLENNEDVIAENNRINKSLEEQNEMYRGLIKAEETNKELAEKEVRRIIGVLTSKSIF